MRSRDGEPYSFPSELSLPGSRSLLPKIWVTREVPNAWDQLVLNTVFITDLKSYLQGAPALDVATQDGDGGRYPPAEHVPKQPTGSLSFLRHRPAQPSLPIAAMGQVFWTQVQSSAGTIMKPYYRSVYQNNQVIQPQPLSICPGDLSPP